MANNYDHIGTNKKLFNLDVNYYDSNSNMNLTIDLNNATSNSSIIISKNPLEMDVYNFWFHCFCCTIGLPLNLFIALGICDRKKKLYEKPRNILLLSLIVCNILTLLMAIDEIVYYFWPDESVCRLFVTVIELPYILFFFNLLLSLVDRYVAMARPVWHHNNVTVSFVSFWIVVLNAALALAVNWVYISGSAQLRCQIEMSQAKTLDATLLVLCVSCIVFTIVDYVETRTLLPVAEDSRNSSRRLSSRRSSGLSVPTVSNRVDTTERQSGDLETFELHNVPIPSLPPPPVRAEPTRMSVHMASASINRLEKEATRTFITAVVGLLLLPCPLLIFTFTHLVCMLVHPEGDQCDDIIWLAPYFKELITLHALIHPIVVILRNKELMDTSNSNNSSQFFDNNHQPTSSNCFNCSFSIC